MQLQWPRMAKEVESTCGTTNSTVATIAKTNFCDYIPPAPLDGVRALYADASVREDGVVNSIVPVSYTMESYDNVMTAEECVNQYNECLQLAPLNFVSINVGDNAVTALIYGGSKLNIIRQSEIVNLSLTPVAEVVFRSIIGEGMCAP